MKKQNKNIMINKFTCDVVIENYSKINSAKNLKMSQQFKNINPGKVTYFNLDKNKKLKHIR